MSLASPEQADISIRMYMSYEETWNDVLEGTVNKCNLE